MKKHSPAPTRVLRSTTKKMSSKPKSLPVEVAMEIISRVPIKTLFRCRCVSKTWHQFLTLDSQFAKLHCVRSIESNKINPNPSILAWPNDRTDLLLALDYTSCDNPIHFNLPFRKDRKEYETFGFGNNTYTIFGICNGLVAILHESRKKSRGERKPQAIYIWNPLTNDYISIPCPPIPALRFPRTRFPHANVDVYDTYGFGWDHAKNEYKVMKDFVEYSQTQEGIFRSHISVYTLGVDSSWRVAVEENPYVIFLSQEDFTNVSLVDGVLHWISEKHGTSSRNLIVGFDLGDEVFREIELPTDLHLDDEDTTSMTVEMGGSLCILSGQHGPEVELWIMKEYGVSTSWTRLLKFNKLEAGLDGICDILGFAQNGEIIMKLARQTMYLCNPETMATRTLKQFGCQVLLSFTYVGSIISPKDISTAGHSVAQKETSKKATRKGKELA